MNQHEQTVHLDILTGLIYRFARCIFMKTAYRVFMGYRSIILSFALLLLGYQSIAQYSNNNWTFGDSCGVRFNAAGIDSFYTTSVKAKGACASISDSLGNLLFYASSPKLSFWQTGIYAQGVVYNKYHQEMENGDSLFTTSAGSNEMIIIPFPNH
jgi:hypothetical protein